MNFINGEVYRFISVNYKTSALNVYGTNIASTGRNVTIYENTPSDRMQNWKYAEDGGIGPRLHSTINNNYVLDRSDGTAAGSANNNAHLCSTNLTSAKDSALRFESMGSNVVRICLKNSINGKVLCLTATNNNGTLPASSITSSILTTANKNVYWAEIASTSDSNYYKQLWKAYHVTTIDSVGFSKQYLVPPYPRTGVRADFGDDCEMIKAAKKAGKKVCFKYDYTVHYGIDLAGRNSSTSATPIKNIKASGYGTVVSIGWGYNLGNRVLVKYPRAAYGDGTNARDIYFMYCHLESVKVSVGQKVTPDTLIGIAGKTGNGARVVHLHLEAFTQEVSDSPSDEGTDTYCVDPIPFFFNSVSSSSVGVREIVPDTAAPFYDSEYCYGDGEGCTHTEKLAFYNSEKINGCGVFREPIY